MTYLYTQANEAKDALSSAAAMVQGDEVVKIACAKYDEIKYVVCRSLQDFILTVNSYLNDERVL